MTPRNTRPPTDDSPLRNVLREERRLGRGAARVLEEVFWGSPVRRRARVVPIRRNDD